MPRTLSLAIALVALSADAGAQRIAPAPVRTPPPGDYTNAPAGFADELLFEGPVDTMGIVPRGFDDVVLWTKAGEVWRWTDGAFQPQPMVDIVEEVGNWGANGMTGFALDPSYATNGHLYLFYVVDRHHLDYFGTPLYDPEKDDFNSPTVARLTRYTVFDPADPATVVDPSTRTVLFGADAASGLPVCSGNHGIGQLHFGSDGTLLLASGDGAPTQWKSECLGAFMQPKEDINGFRAQLVDSGLGKILRVDPATGDGVPSNPFFDGAAPRAWRSRVWALGLRNPFGFAVRPEASGPGTLFVGDVGSNDWEELSLVTGGGHNFGWPVYEGYVEDPVYSKSQLQNLDAPNPLFGGACTLPFFRFTDLLVEDSQLAPFWPNPCAPTVSIPASIPRFVHERPVLVWGHADTHPTRTVRVKGYGAQGQAVTFPLGGPGTSTSGRPFWGNCSIAGVWYSGTAFPARFRNVYFHADYGEGWIRTVSFDDQDELVAVGEFGSWLGGLTQIATDPAQQALFYLDFPAARIGRISFVKNVAPIASATSTPVWGPSPLRVQLSAAGSTDPEGKPLAYDWEFGDGEAKTPLHATPNPVHVYPSEDATLDARPIASRPRLATAAPGEEPPVPVVGLDAIRDGLYAPVGSTSESAQVLVAHRDPWIGQLLDRERVVVALVVQEGLVQGSAGATPRAPVVEAWNAEGRRWEPVANLVSVPEYPGDPTLSYETFHLSFDPVTTAAIRVRETARAPGPRRITVGELRVLALPESPGGPAGRTATVEVTDPGGRTDTASTLISFDNTPPFVEIAAPAPGATYPVGIPVTIELASILSDAEHPVSSLSCAWRPVLVHDNHVHPEPILTSCSGGAFTILPHGELMGEVIYWNIELTVTDPAGLSTFVQRQLIPENDCNLNGIHDGRDIETGTSLDLNGNGIPDECETGEARSGASVVPPAPTDR